MRDPVDDVNQEADDNGADGETKVIYHVGDGGRNELYTLLCERKKEKGCYFCHSPFMA